MAIDDDHDDSSDRSPGKFPYHGWDTPPDARKHDRQYSPHYRGDNSGGYGNPPISGQKRKGGPPGPGRPKGSTSLDAKMKKVFRRRLPILKDGRMTQLHASEIFAERILEAILSKNPTPAMIELGRRLMIEYGPPVPSEVEPGNTEGFSRDELKITLALLSRVMRDKPRRSRRHVVGMVDEAFPIGLVRTYRREDGHIGLEVVTDAVEPDETT